MRSKLALILSGAALGATVIAAAVAVGVWQHARVTGSAGHHTLDSSQALLRELDARETGWLEAVSRSLSTDAGFVSYIAQALGEGDGETRDIASIRDLLDERRRNASVDAAAILDGSGKLVLATGEPFLAQHDLSKLPGAAKSLREFTQASDSLDDDEHAPLITFTPLMQGSALNAVLVTGAKFDGKLLTTMAQISGADFAVVGYDANAPRIAATTLDPRRAQAIAKAVAGLPKELAGSNAATPGDFRLDVEDKAWLARVLPLHPGSSHATLLALVPLDHDGTMLGIIAWPLLIAVFAALALLTLMTGTLWRLGLSPLAAIEDLSPRIAHGDFALHVQPRGFEAIRRVQGVFNLLLATLDLHRALPGTPRRRATDRPTAPLAEART